MLFLVTFPILYVWELAAAFLATYSSLYVGKAATVFLPTLLSSSLSFVNDEIVQLQKLSRI
jgi:hypothetical protein